MSDFSDSLGASTSLNAAQAQHEAKLQTALQAGLAALKQRDYREAIARLSDCEASLDAAIRLKAQMGMIKAYVRTEQVQAAALLAQPLCEHSNPQVQAWAKQTLAELTDPHSPLDSALDSTGFVPLASAGQPTPVRSFSPAAKPAPSSRLTQARDSRTADRKIAKPEVAKPKVAKPEAAKTAALVPFKAQANAQARTASDSADFSWRNAGRVQKWNPLSAVDASGLWALQAGSLVLLFWISKTLFALGIWPLEWLLNWVR